MNGNSLNPCPAPGMPSASRGAAMVFPCSLFPIPSSLFSVPWAALQARHLELDMRCGMRGGDSAAVTGLDQRVSDRGDSDIMSLSEARPKCLSSGRTTQARNSPAQAQPNPARPRRQGEVNGGMLMD
jgi:hypothetical protein